MCVISEEHLNLISREPFLVGCCRYLNQLFFKNGLQDSQLGFLQIHAKTKRLCYNISNKDDWSKR